MIYNAAYVVFLVFGECAKWRQRRLTEDQILQLNQISMQWESQKDLLRMQEYKVAEAFFETNGYLNIPSTDKTPEGFALGK